MKYIGVEFQYPATCQLTAIHEGIDECVTDPPTERVGIEVVEEVRCARLRLIPLLSLSQKFDDATKYELFPITTRLAISLGRLPGDFQLWPAGSSDEASEEVDNLVGDLVGDRDRKLK